MTRSFGRLLPAVLVLAAAAALRFYHLDHASVWGDEACMLELAKLPAREIVHVLAANDRPDTDVAPPLYFLALRGFTRAFGLSVFTSRLLSAGFSLLTIPLVAALGRLACDDRTGRIAALLTGASALQVWYAQEARMYALVTLLATAATLALFAYLKSGRGGAAYVIAAALALYTQYYAYLLVATHVALGLLVLLARGQRRRALGLLAMGVALGILVLPWIPILFSDFHQAQRFDRGFPSNFSLLGSIPFVFAKFALFANEVYLRDRLPLYLVMGPVFAWFFLRGALALTRGFPAGPGLLFGFTVLPMAAVVAGSALGASIYKSHPFILLSPFFYVLTAHGLTRSRRRRGWVAAALMVAANGYVLLTLNFGEAYVKPRVKEALAFVKSNLRPGDVVVKIPSKLHTQPVQTGEILSWILYAAPQGIEVLECNGSGQEDLLRRLDALTASRARFFLAVADTQYTAALKEPLLDACARRYRLAASESFPSRIRDFGLSLYLFELAPGGER